MQSPSDNWLVQFQDLVDFRLVALSPGQVRVSGARARHIMRTVKESSCSDGRVVRGLVLTDIDGQNSVAFF